MISKILQLAKLVLVLSAAAVCLLLCAGLWQMRMLPKHINGVLTRAEGVELKINASAVNLDKATGAWANSAQEQAASINALVSAARGTLETANAQLGHVGPLLDQTRTTIAGAGDDIHALAESGRQVATSAGASMAAAQPVLDASARTVEHIDAEVTALSPELDRMIRASADTTEHVAGITADTHKMTSHLERDFDAPKPWWKRTLPVFTDSAKLAECFTRGNCF